MRSELVLRVCVEKALHCGSRRLFERQSRKIIDIFDRDKRVTGEFVKAEIEERCVGIAVASDQAAVKCVSPAATPVVADIRGINMVAEGAPKYGYQTRNRPHDRYRVAMSVNDTCVRISRQQFTEPE